MLYDNTGLQQFNSDEFAGLKFYFDNFCKVLVSCKRHATPSVVV